GRDDMVNRLFLVNPNTQAATTAAMVDIASDVAPPGIEVVGLTVKAGPPVIVEPVALAAAAQAVLEAVEGIDTGRSLGVLIAAFGDPGLAQTRRRLRVPVTGIGEAGMAEAGQRGRPFAVVTTTPDLVESIHAQARTYGHDSAFLGVRLTPGDPLSLMADPARLLDALEEACRVATERDGAQAILIGGGPLAQAARALRERLRAPHTVEIVEPIPAAVRLALARAAASGAIGRQGWGQ
ncbi:MAG: aspartate/glutamate racemase family protein, partial [Rubrivivax sp.]